MNDFRAASQESLSRWRFWPPLKYPSVLLDSSNVSFSRCILNTMDYVRLGNTGLKVSRICLGAMTYGTPEWRPWVLDEAASRPFIARALEHGINFFDTADMYSLGVSEEVLGRALKDFAKRDNVVVATKVFFP